MRRKLLSIAIIATLALSVAISDSSAAARTYTVNSTSQVAPSTVKALRQQPRLRAQEGSRGAIGPTGTSDGDSWTLGWSAVSALLTVLLAGGTILLALTTSRDVRARQRPMVWADGDAILRIHPTGPLCDIELSLANIGGGPAISLYAQMHTVVPKNGGTTPGVLRGSISPGDKTLIRQSLPGEAASYLNVLKLMAGLDVVIKYQDVRGRDYRTDLVFCDQSRPFIFFSELPSEPVEFQLALTESLFSEFAWLDRRLLQFRRWRNRKKVFIPPKRAKRLGSPKRAERRKRSRSEVR